MVLKGLSILSLNVRGLYSNLNELQARFSDFDVLCFSETWLNSTYNDQMINIQGFEIFRLDREVGNIRTKTGKKKRGGGLIIYIKNELAQYTSVIEESSSITPEMEQLWIRIAKPNAGTKIVANIYRPPNGSVQTALTNLSNATKIAQDTSRHELVIVGDFNINYNLRHSHPSKLLKTFERDFNLAQLIQKPTRTSNTSKSCIDLIFTNMEYIISSGVLDILISDHLPTFLIKKKQRQQIKTDNIKCRSYATYEKQNFQDDIKAHPKWANFWEVNENDPEKMWDIMEEIIRSTVNSHCPYKNVKIKEDTPQWINREILSELRHKDHLYNKAKKSGSPLDWALFKQKKNEIKKLLATAKENFVKNMLDDLEGNQKKFWRTLKNITGLGKNKNGRKCTKIRDDHGRVLENMEAATFLNEFYVNVGPSLASNHNKKWDKEKAKIETKATFNFSWVPEAEIKRLIKDICITKSSALEGINTRLLRDAFEVLTFELTYIYNSCLQNGIFPLKWGISKVTPIPKTKAYSTKPGDWRPISQICLPGKLLEKIIHAQLSHFLESNNILSNNQYGFRRGLSTNAAVFEVLKTLHQNWDDKLYSGCIFIDFSRAFDTINHQILMEKLKLYGFDDTPLNFMQTYMHSRKQMTIVNGISSPLEPVTHGTAQGSILGPLIFLLYVNDIFNSLEENSNAFMYADDTLLVCKDQNPVKVTEKAQKAMSKIHKWCQANKLNINLDKTKYMIVRHMKVHHEPEFKLEQFNLSTVHQYEYLGMTLDDRLTMNDYLDGIWKKTNAKIGILSKVRRFISVKTATRIYKCMIRPHLDYVDYVIDSGSADRIRNLDNLQKKAIRRIEYCSLPENRKDTDSLQDLYKIEPLKLRRKRNLVKIMFTETLKEDNLYKSKSLMKLRSADNTNLKVGFTSKSKVFNSPLYRGLKLWNSLPPDIQNEKDIYNFKKKLSKYDFKTNN